MATIYRSWAQTKLIPGKTRTGSLAVTYYPELVAMHAVEEKDGVVATRAVCGRPVPSGGDVQDTFGPAPVMDGCSSCCAVLGMERFKS